jgi:hypothetical protein
MWEERWVQLVGVLILFGVPLGIACGLLWLYKRTGKLTWSIGCWWTL